MEKKKIRLDMNEDGGISISRYSRDLPHFTLYAGISALYGGWLADTDGVTTLNDFEVAFADAEDEEVRRGAESAIAFINDLIADTAAPWEPLDERDEEYIADVLEGWGLSE